MLRYIIKRLIQMVPLLIIISFIAFGIIRMAEVYAGADPLAQMKMSPSITEETIRREKQRMGYETGKSESFTPTGPTYSLNTSSAVADDSVTLKYKDSGDRLKLVRPSEEQTPAQAVTTAGQFAFKDNTLYLHSADTGKALELEYGIPNSFVKRYSIWAWNFIRTDMGESYYYKAPVSTLILSRLGNTAILGLATLVFTWLIALPLGIYLAVKQYSFVDQVFSSVSYFFMGFPDFFLAVIFLLFAAVTGWFPIGGMTSSSFNDLSAAGKAVDIIHHLILPTLTLSLISIASLQRRMRANMLDILGEEYIKTARAKGLSENKVIYKHAVRNAINPIITLLGFEIAGLISGAAFVEIIFNWPGLGNMMLQAVLGTDLNLVMANLVISSFMLLMGNLIADLLLAFVDPRIKLEA